MGFTAVRAPLRPVASLQGFQVSSGRLQLAAAPFCVIPHSSAAAARSRGKDLHRILEFLSVKTCSFAAMPLIDLLLVCNHLFVIGVHRG